MRANKPAFFYSPEVFELFKFFDFDVAEADC